MLALSRYFSQPLQKYQKSQFCGGGDNRSVIICFAQSLWILSSWCSLYLSTLLYSASLWKFVFLSLTLFGDFAQFSDECELIVTVQR